MLELTRLPEWQANLGGYLLEKMRLTNQGLLTFAWDPSVGDALNCLQFASGAVEAVTGVDVYEQQASDLKYTSPKEALKVLHDLGHNSVDQLIGSLFPPKHYNYLITGDLVVVPGHLGEGERDGGEEDTAELDGLRAVVAVADPPFFWVVSSQGGLAKGSILRVAKNYGIKAYAVAS